MASDSIIPSARLGKQPRLLRREVLLSPHEVDERNEGAEDTEHTMFLESDATLAAALEEESESPVDPAETSNTAVSETVVATAAHDELRAALYAELQAEYATAAEAARAQASEQGYEAGYRAGEVKGAEEYARMIETYRELVAGASAAMESGIGGLTDIVVEMAFEATVKILGASMVERDGVVAVVRELIDRVSSSTKLLIRVSPEDYEILNSERTRLLSGFEASQVEIVSDDRVVLGGCLLETPSGNLDGRLEIQLQHLRDTLLAAKARWPDPDLGAKA